LLGKLIDYLKISESNPTFRIVSKRFDKSAQQHIFTLISDKQEHFMRSASEIVSDKNILENLGVSDVYDIGFTQGGESILKEKMALLLLKNQK
jgi:phosphoserine aminotransferase